MNTSTSLVRPLRVVLSHCIPRKSNSAPARHFTSAQCVSAAATGSSSQQPSGAGLSASLAKPKGPKRAASSCPAGTVMTGLSILKDQPDPVALPDDQYPAWLWTLLDEPAASGSAAKTVGGAAAGEGGKERIPGDLKSGVDFREEKKRLRAANRANIKAANYLKTT